MGVLGLAAIGTIYVLWPKPVDVDLATVAVGPMNVTVDEDGMTRVKERYTVSSPVAGQLLRIELEPGDPIQAGKTLLATLQPSDPNLLDARQVAEAEARVAGARVMIERGAAKQEQARIQKELADKNMARAEPLWEQNSISQREYEEVTGMARSRSEELRAAKFDGEIAKFELQQSEAALLRVTPTVGSAPQPQFEIFAPIDGHVLRVLQESATVVAPGSPLLEVGNRRDLEIVVDVLSTDAVKIQPGDEVRLEHWGGEVPLVATVRMIEPAAFTKISALGVEEQRVNIIADFKEGQAAVASLGDGFRVEARIVVWQDERILKVPSSALFRGGDKWFVFVNKDDIARKTGVAVGHRNGQDTEILSGLKEGQQIILYPSDLVIDGVKLVARSE